MSYHWGRLVFNQVLSGMHGLGRDLPSQKRMRLFRDRVQFERFLGRVAGLPIDPAWRGAKLLNRAFAAGPDGGLVKPQMQKRFLAFRDGTDRASSRS